MTTATCTWSFWRVPWRGQVSWCSGEHCDTRAPALTTPN